MKKVIFGVIAVAVLLGFLMLGNREETTQGQAVEKAVEQVAQVQAVEVKKIKSIEAVVEMTQSDLTVEQIDKLAKLGIKASRSRSLQLTKN